MIYKIKVDITNYLKIEKVLFDNGYMWVYDSKPKKYAYKLSQYLIRNYKIFFLIEEISGKKEISWVYDGVDNYNTITINVLFRKEKIKKLLC